MDAHPISVSAVFPSVIMHGVRTILVLLFFAFVAPGISPAFTQQQSADEMVVQGRLYVQFADDNLRLSAGNTGNTALDLRTSRYGVTVIEKAFPSLDVIATHRPLSPEMESLRQIYLIRYTTTDHPRDAAEDFSTVPIIRYAEPVYMSEVFGFPPEDNPDPQATPNDSLYADQGELRVIRLDRAWDLFKGEDSSILIAIVDGQIDWQHEDLEANVWTNPGEVDGDGMDNDQNGYVDDIHGWNFYQNSPDPNDPWNEPGKHGTAVAGIAAAVTDNNIGIAGASWNAQFMPLNTRCDNGVGLCYALDALVYASMNGADIATASYGSNYYSITAETVYRSVTEEGLLVVAAAGNNTVDNDIHPLYPANYPMVLSVGGLRENSDRNRYNYGTVVNVFAQGTYIDFPVPYDRYEWAGGTSYAAPQVAGVAVLVKMAFPHYDAHRVREQIRMTAVNIDHANHTPGKFGRGKVDAYAAVTEDPKPAIRVTNVSYLNQHGYEDSRIGDTVDVQVTFTNYHGAGSDLRAELTSEATFLEWLTTSGSLGHMDTGDTRSSLFTFVVSPGAPDVSQTGFSPKITAPGFEDSPDFFSLIINQSSVRHHTTRSLLTSVTEEGNIGHRDYQNVHNTKAKGFVLTRSDWTRKDVLYEGGLLIATGEEYVSDCLRQEERNANGQQADWVPVEGSRLEFFSPGQRAPQETRVTLSDAAARRPIGVEVLQETFVTPGYVNEDFIIYRYTITNASGAKIENMYAGLFFDWDVDDDARDVFRFDSTRSVGYIMDSATRPTAVAGTLHLTSHPLNYTAIDNGYIYRGGLLYDGFTPREKWYTLSGGLRADEFEGPERDFSQMTSAGPLTLEVGEDVVVGFAIIAARGEFEFLNNVDNARALWKTIFVSAQEEVVSHSSWQVHSPYPHPATFPVTLQYETAATSVVELEIYDLLGASGTPPS